LGLAQHLCERHASCLADGLGELLCIERCRDGQDGRGLGRGGRLGAVRGGGGHLGEKKKMIFSFRPVSSLQLVWCFLLVLLSSVQLVRAVLQIKIDEEYSKKKKKCQKKKKKKMSKVNLGDCFESGSLSRLTTASLVVIRRLRLGRA
jgi:hypothetical protein